MSFYLEDANGFAWLISITDTGLLQATKGSLGTILNMFLNDPGNTTSWQLGIVLVGNDGVPQFTSVTPNAAYQRSILLTSPSGFSWALTITSGGIVQLQEVTFPSVLGIAAQASPPQINRRRSNMVY